ncbi:hypothetical protein Tco_1171822, partial [Tanacetum coccineum]
CHQVYERTSTPNIESDTLSPQRILNPSNQEDPILSTKSYFSNSSPSAVLNEWILNSFDVEVVFARIRNYPCSRSLDEYKAVFDNEIEQLANEYELIIGKNGGCLAIGKSERVKVQRNDPKGDEHRRKCPKRDVDLP